MQEDRVMNELAVTGVKWLYFIFVPISYLLLKKEFYKSIPTFWSNKRTNNNNKKKTKIPMN